MNPAEGIVGTTLFGKYRIEGILGKGGMGMVYRARHLQLQEDIAIKVLRADIAMDEETVTRFVREAQSAVKLKSEHVARITDVGTFDDGLPFMVMELLLGADLGQMIEANGPMPSTYAADFVLQACDALAEAHSIGIVHRDIKPTNLFVSMRPDQSTIVKVLDFGISKSATGTDLSLTQTSSMLGTPAYMSPEQMRSARTVDARTDIWSLGTVLYELVEGRRPFNAESFSEMCVMVAIDPPSPMQHARELEPVILRCLAKRPEERYANIAELARDLAAYAGNPDAARHYVSRTHRVLGLRPPIASDSQLSIARPSYATPVPGSLATIPAGSATQPAFGASVPLPTLAPARPSSKRVWIALVAALIGIGAAVAIISASKSSSSTTSARAAQLGSADPGSATAAGTGSATPIAAGSAGSGSAAKVVDGAGAGAGSATKVVDGAGSGSATKVVDAAGAGSGSAKPITRPPIRKPARPPVRPIADPHKGSAATVAPPPTPPTPTKPCDPFDSRRGC